MNSDSPQKETLSNQEISEVILGTLLSTCENLAIDIELEPPKVFTPGLAKAPTGDVRFFEVNAIVKSEESLLSVLSLLGEDNVNLVNEQDRHFRFGLVVRVTSEFSAKEELNAYEFVQKLNGVETLKTLPGGSINQGILITIFKPDMQPLQSFPGIFSEREGVFGELLDNLFILQQNGFMHNDLHLSNIGYYGDPTSGKIHLVFHDFELAEIGLPAEEIQEAIVKDVNVMLRKVSDYQLSHLRKEDLDYIAYEYERYLQKLIDAELINENGIESLQRTLENIFSRIH